MLNVSHNQIREQGGRQFLLVVKEVFADLRFIQKIDLSSNYITQLDYGFKDF